MVSNLNPHHVSPTFIGDGSFNYLADDKLCRAVNLAIALGRPLLVRGEPGVGKTQLARAIAAELTPGQKPLEWRIKSTDNVREGLYFYDPIRRLIDTQLVTESKEHVQRAINPYNYIRFSYLGKAIINPEPVVLLIDEIDKADLDFPSDLLRELEDWWFQIHEVPLDIGNIDPEAFGRQQETLSEAQILENATQSPENASKYAIIHLGSKPRPIVIITSNEEKQLPPAFLRRCIVHTIEFPDLNAKDPEQLRKNRDHVRRIIEMNVKHRLQIGMLEQQVVDRVIEIFGLIRGFKDHLTKAPATVEMVEWVVALHHPELKSKLGELTSGRPLPYWQVMFKSRYDEQYVADHLKDYLEIDP